MKKVIKITESDLERLVKRILKEEDNFDPIENALEQLKGNKAYPIENIAKETNIGYQILGLPPFEALKGYIIKPVSDFIWGLYDKNVRDQELVQLKVEDGKYIVDFKMNPK